MKNYNETNIPSMTSQEFNAAGYDVEENDIQGILKSTLLSIVKFLKIKRDKKNPVAIEIKNGKDEYILGSQINYIESEDEETKGSWNLSFTFDQEDLKDIETKFTNKNDEYDIFLNNEFKYQGWSIVSGVNRYDFISIPLYSIKKYLEYNASEDHELEINLLDLGKVSVCFEEGKRVYSIESSEVLRQYLKDDAN